VNKLVVIRAQDTKYLSVQHKSHKTPVAFSKLKILKVIELISGIDRTENEKSTLPTCSVLGGGVC
jgi:hypothetical protein